MRIRQKRMSADRPHKTESTAMAWMGFLSLKDFKRAVNTEMQAIKMMKPID